MMNRVEFFSSGKAVNVPSSWSEMSPGQVRAVFRLYDSCIRKRKSPLEFNVRTLCLLLGVRHTLKGLWKSFRTGFLSIGENIYLMCDSLLGFLFDRGNLNLSFDYQDNCLPSVRSGFSRL